jgi:hypothetical protein
MGLSSTTALLDLSLTFPFDHFFFLLDGQYRSFQNHFIHIPFIQRPISFSSEMMTYPALDPACAAAAFWATSSATLSCNY